MKKITLQMFVAVIFAAAFTVSCKKEDNNEDKLSLLTKASWKPVSITDNGEEDIWDCEKDDTYTFTKSTIADLFAGAYNPGANICDEEDPETAESFTWKLIENDTKLVWFGDTATINKLDANTLKLTYTEDGDVLVETYNH